MKVNRILEFYSRHKVTAALSGFVITTVVGSLLFAQTVFGQDTVRPTTETSGTEQSIVLESTEKEPSGRFEVTSAPSSKSSRSAIKETLGSTVIPSKNDETALEPTDESSAGKTSETPATVAAAATAAPATSQAATQQAATQQATAAETAAAATTAAASGGYDSSLAAAAFELVNQQRAANGLPGLSWSDSLASAASIRAQEISVCWSHTRPDGSDCFTAYPGGFSILAENIAAGQASAQSVVDSWMQSEGHRANILSPAVTQSAISCYCIDGVYYWAQSFGG